jgi:hypothetical protein
MRNPELLESRNGLPGRSAPTTMTWRGDLRIEHCLATKVSTNVAPTFMRRARHCTCRRRVGGGRYRRHEQEGLGATMRWSRAASILRLADSLGVRDVLGAHDAAHPRAVGDAYYLTNPIGVAPIAAWCYAG